MFAGDHLLRLRVFLKLLFLFALIMAVWMIVQYIFGDKHVANETRMQVDLGSLPVGAHREVQYRGRPLIILHRSPEMLDQLGHDAITNPFLVVYQWSPDLSCPLEVMRHSDTEPGGFRAVCSGTRYDLDGRLLPGEKGRLDLQSPAFEIQDNMLILDP